MNIADILNPQQQQQQQQQQQMLSPPPSPLSTQSTREFIDHRLLQVHGKPRSRFSDVEDAIICEGVARGLTWGQISRQLPHRKRATCFNRYRTLQGIRKSRKRPSLDASPINNNNAGKQHRPSLVPPSPESLGSASSPTWLPSTPPSYSPIAASSPASTSSSSSCSSSPAAPPAADPHILPSPKDLLHSHPADEDAFHPTRRGFQPYQPVPVRLPPLVVPRPMVPAQRI
ncbi:hypothetical protein BCR43DRAFT_280338 [Syncephalastrum racemosum]|uniref:Myb-like domain-containing protein n=1 Tax=Syncephalastrum racemosum TaxID=13706 RepID=A0A1X2HCP8_SYNRA|nr:hypothetical protein BCR43DRAFT_280338 [Syncephalastrum racemosum]